MMLSNYIDSVSMEIDEIDYGTTESNENFQYIVISHKSVVRKISKIIPSQIYTKCPISIPPIQSMFHEEKHF